MLSLLWNTFLTMASELAYRWLMTVEGSLVVQSVFG